MKHERIIFHIDVNSAFLAWTAAYKKNILGEELDLRDVASIVGGNQESRHGIVLAKSAKAKAAGIHTGEAIVAARQKCPNLIVAPPDYHLYVSASRALMEILHRYTDEVTQYSIDEAWAEFTGFDRLYGGVVTFANDLKNEIKRELGFTVNIGVSTNRLLSKMAGDFKKPDLVHTLFPEEIPKKMWPLPVDNLFFVGTATVKKLHMLGIYTIGELANADLNILKSHLKNHGEVIWNYANGNDLIPYVYQHISNKGYGNSITTPADVVEISQAKQVLLSLTETVATRIRMDQVKISCVSVSITTSSFERSSMQMQLKTVTDVTEEIYLAACEIFDRMYEPTLIIRQLGVHTSHVAVDGVRQYNLFDKDRFDKLEQYHKAIDSIRRKYGEDSVQRACFLGGKISHLSGGLDKERRTGVTLGLDLAKEQEVSGRGM